MAPVLAAARRTTIEAVCANLPGAPDSNTVRGYLTEQLPPSGIPDLEQQWNGLLRTLLPDWLRHRPQDIAVDFQKDRTVVDGQRQYGYWGLTRK